MPRRTPRHRLLAGRREHARASAADAAEQLAQARRQQRQVQARAPEVDALAAEAARLARRNKIAELVYRGLLSGE